MKKYITSIFIILSLLFLSAIAAYAEEVPFCGSRTLVCTFDRSDLNNFIDGGSKTFENILSETLPSWCSYEIEKQKRDMKITLCFSFDKRDEYETYMKQLLGYRPVIIYDPSESFKFVENFDSAQMFHFLQKQLLSNNMMKELKFDRLIKIENCMIDLNGKTYETKENFDVRDGNHIRFDELELVTTSNGDGGFERTIRAKIRKEHLIDSTKSAVWTNFKAAGEISNENKNSDNLDITVSIKAENQYELSKKTLLAAGLTVSTLETETPQKDFVLVDCMERIGVTKVLNEDGNFEYSFTYPQYYKNLSITESDTLSVHENQIRYSGEEGQFEYSYQRGLKLSALQVRTDYSNMFKGIERKIIFSIPLDTAKVFDEKILNTLYNVKTNDRKANISTDVEGENKTYCIAVHSRDSKKITEFTQKIIRGDNRIEYEKSMIPFQKNRISETIRVGKMIDDMIPIAEFELIYKLPDKTNLLSSNIEECSFYNNEYSTVLGSDATIDIEFNTINKVVLFIVILCLAVIFCFLLIAFIRINLHGRKQKK